MTNVPAMFALTDKVAIVTGASRGIGRACAIAFAQAGADIVLAARNQKDLDEVARDIEALGRRALTVVCDVSDEASLDALVARAMAEFGKINVLVNNAGGSGPNDPDQTTAEQLNQALIWNVTPAFLLTKKVNTQLPDTLEAGLIR